MNKELSLKGASKAAVILMGVLLIGAIVFYKERMLFVDSCFMVFNILNSHHFMIQEFRYGSFITQMVPLMAGKLHLPLSVVLISYSISFNLFYFIVILLLVYRYQQYSLAILMALYYSLFVSASYFWTNNEVHQGIAWMFLAFGLLLHQRDKKKIAPLFIIIFLLLSFLAISCHFIVIIPFTFLWIFFRLNKQTAFLSTRLFTLFSIFIALIIAIKFLLALSGWYDIDKLNSISALKLSDVTSVISGAQAKRTLILFISNYWLGVLIFVVGIISLIKAKRYLLLALTVLYSLVYFMLVCIMFPDYAEGQTFYMESEWMSLSIIVSATFVYYFLPAIKDSWAVGLICVIFVIRVAYIGLATPVFTGRVDFIEGVKTQMQKKGLTKVVVKTNPMIEKKLLMDWGVPVESLCASVLDKNNPSLTFAIVNVSDSSFHIPVSKKQMVSCFVNTDVKVLNPRYFRIDTSTLYSVLTYEELFAK